MFPVSAMRWRPVAGSDTADMICEPPGVVPRRILYVSAVPLSTSNAGVHWARMPVGPRAVERLVGAGGGVLDLVEALTQRKRPVTFQPVSPEMRRSRSPSLSV